MDYQKLAANEIRLIVLHQGPDYANIEVSPIPRVALGEGVSYIALSYTWGDPEDLQTIIIDGVNLKITRNLAAFLWHIRKELDPDSQLILWVDAICINQQDIEDKNQQLLLMRQIYVEAQSTLIWLGPATDDIGKAVDLITMTCEEPHDGQESRLSTWLMDEANEQLLMGSPTSCESLVALASLLSRPWFFRIWVIQEVVLAQSILMRCGSYQLSLLDVFATPITLQNYPIAKKSFEEMTLAHPDLKQGLIHTLSQLGHVIDAWNNKQLTEESDPLLNLLLRYRGNGASNPRDKIYALLGILKLRDTHSSRTAQSMGYDPSLLLVDYDAEVVEVYKSLVRSVVVETQKLDVICASHGALRSSLPSWTPDWSQPWNGENLIYRDTNHYPHFQASREVPSQVDFSHISQGIMHATGLMVDEVKEIWPLLDYDEDPSAGYLKKAREWRRQENYGVYKCKETANDALWRTLVGNVGIDWKEPPKEWATVFENWMTGAITVKNPIPVDGSNFFNRVWATGIGRRTATTENQYYFAIVPETALASDLICVLLGCSLPVVLRKVAKSAGDHQEFFEFVGESYVHGIMNGEALEGIDARGKELVNFELH